MKVETAKKILFSRDSFIPQKSGAIHLTASNDDAIPTNNQSRWIRAGPVILSSNQFVRHTCQLFKLSIAARQDCLGNA